MDPAGEGGHLALSNCTGSFDGLTACGANDTMFYNGHAGNKGGAVVISGTDEPLRVEFHRCTVHNSSAGGYVEDDPQGEGGVFSVGAGAILLVADCIIEDNYCGKKVPKHAFVCVLRFTMFIHTCGIAGPGYNSSVFSSLWDVRLIS